MELYIERLNRIAADCGCNSGFIYEKNKSVDGDTVCLVCMYLHPILQNPVIIGQNIGDHTGNRGSAVKQDYERKDRFWRWTGSVCYGFGARVLGQS